ncbi:hypothetical protein VSF3289_02718 [Vibrio scophthalmi]|uniref:Uncharacterized protein n=1 Tax=Vibrio scophthalmi TaxID=45658 RepID=A0A1E3WRL8_9VIBR|nr:hypothetical protein VSF3289_02718 [Vibrio scophthalmi]
MVDCFELSDAKLMQENGVISKVEIITEESNRYMITFLGKNGQKFYLKTQRGNIRYFKTLDSAFNTIQSLGYDVSKLVVVDKRA